MDAKAEKIALFRYGLIAPLVLEPLPRGELTRRAEEIAARRYEIPASQRTSVSVDTLLDWALRYRNGGFEALAPQPRQDRGQSRTITPQLADLIERLKRENPHRTGTTLLRELALSGQNEPAISASTLYRFLKQRGLTERQLLAPPAHKKFEAEFANQIWQSDMLYGPYIRRPGGGKMQALLHAILDDASRLIPHAQFYASEGLDVCLDCLRQAVAARGVAVRLYMDNAKIYRSPQLARIAASIGMLIVHTPPYQPEGRGKIERFFRSVREQFLNNLDRKQTLSLEELNERLCAWLDLYHRTEHSSLGTTPLLRWQRDIEHIRQLPPATDFRRLFFHRLDRVVRRDCTFQLHNRFYEAPPHLAGETIEARFTSGSALDLLRQIALELGIEPAHYRGDLVRQISEAIVHLNRSKKQHPILICDEAQLLRHPALEQLPLLLNFDMDSSHYLTLLLIGEPLLRRTLSLQMHEPLRQRIAVQYHLDGLSREELDAYLAQQLKAAGVGQPLFDDTARQALYQATKGILRKVNKLALTALRLAAARKLQAVNEAILLDATSEALL